MHNLINVYMWYEGKLFDNIKLYNPIDKEILVNTILDECGEMIPVTGHFQFFQMKIENFFARQYDNFKRLWDAYNADYAILENYDRMGSFEETGNTSHTVEDVEHGNIDFEENGTSNNVNDGTTNTDHNLTSTKDEDETNKISAYDSDSFQNSAKRELDSTTTDDESTDVTEHSTNNRTDHVSNNTASTKTNTSNFDESTGGTRTERVHGNIGVTTSQQMLESELRLRNYNNFYNDVARMFAKELMVAMFSYRD